MRIAIVLLLTTFAVNAQTLQQRVERELPNLVDTYKGFHANPEVSMQEKKTSAVLADRLRALGYKVMYPVGKYAEEGATCYGVVAVLENGKGPTVLVRTDMDALPIEEQTGVAYASTTPAAMHACGHDIHMTTLLGSAKLLAEMRKQWHGTLILVGQPAEEVVKGADAILRDNLYTRVPRPDYALAIHDWASLEAGRIGYHSGFFYANADSVNVTIRGVGGHGASPEKTKDPVVVAAETILALQTIVSRERSPLDPVVITVGQIQGGTKRNIIPDEVKLFLTVRTYKPEVRKRVLESIERVARGVAIAAGMPEDRMPIFEHLENESTDALYNDPALTERLVKAAKRELGDANVVEIDPAMVSEDFGRFGLDRQIPIAMLSVGAADPASLASGRQPGLHSSKFAPNPELVLPVAIRTVVSGVINLLQ